MSYKRLDIDVWIGDHGIHLSSKGDELVIRARFSRSRGDLDQFLAYLRHAMERWCLHHPLPKEAPASGKVPAALSPRFPANATEEGELKALAAEGPAAVYGWIYGPTSMMAKAMEHITWKQFGASDPSEGCARILKSIRDHDEDLRAVRPNLRRGRTLPRA